MRKPDGRSFAQDDGMDGLARRRECLRALGIRGHNLDLLAAEPSLSPEVITGLAAEIRMDRNVRNMSAVLAYRLLVKTGRRRVSPAACRSPIPPEARRLVASVEQARRNAPRARGSSKLGDVLVQSGFAPRITEEDES